MSQDETKQYIDQVARELMLASHQSRDKEVSGLFKEIKSDINNMRSDLDRIEGAVVDLQSLYSTEILPNVKSWNSTSANVEWGVRIVMGVLLTAAVGALIALQI